MPEDVMAAKIASLKDAGDKIVKISDADGKNAVRVKFSPQLTAAAFDILAATLGRLEWSVEE